MADVIVRCISNVHQVIGYKTLKYGDVEPIPEDLANALVGAKIVEILSDSSEAEPSANSTGGTSKSKTDDNKSEIDKGKTLIVDSNQTPATVLRKVEVLRADVWESVETLLDVKEGDTFKLSEPNGEPVPGLWKATRDGYADEDGTPAISCDEIVETATSETATSETKETNPAATEVKSDQFICDICGKVFESKRQLTGHMMSHKPKQPK